MENEWTGPYVFGHTNITEIERGVDLLRRNNVDLDKVSLGMGFYGRTFTLADSGCNEPGCVFVEAGAKGDCSGEDGILTFKGTYGPEHYSRLLPQYLTGVCLGSRNPLAPTSAERGAPVLRRGKRRTVYGLRPDAMDHV
jgi:hypothetical protein